jgi:MFS family permease/quinol monooxygenase YgiN
MTAAADSPLRTPVFRALWIAAIVSNIGTWMQDVGAGWLMTSLSRSPLMVALVQAATTLPMFMLSMPAGALADIVDRRRLLIAAQLAMMAGAALLSAVTFASLASPSLLLAMIGAIATSMTLSAPAFQATIPELVPQQSLTQAASLMSLGVNISRAVGPALGGLIIAAAGGPAAVFALNALSGIGIVMVLARWHHAPRPSSLPVERFLGALRAGVRYTRQSPAMTTVLLRSAGFFVFASALWALLPVIGRRDLALDSTGYGALLAMLGFGAIAGALMLRKAVGWISCNALTIAASLLFAVAMALLGLARSFAAATPVLFVTGIAWIAVMSALSGAAQMAAPQWVKARTLALYMLVSQGAMTAGATFWGWLAAHAGTAVALFTASAALAAAQVLALRFSLDASATLNLATAPDWPAPHVSDDVPGDRGPVLVTIEYQVASADIPEFARAMQLLRGSRRRNGAIAWGVYEDAARPGEFVETFLVESWIEHLRQHERETHADRAHEEAVMQFHVGAQAPLVRHLIAPA